MQVGCAVIYDHGNILLLKKNKGKFLNKYEFPGGKREQHDQNIKECVHREVMEETGYDSKVLDLIHFMKISKEDLNSEEDCNVYFYHVHIFGNQNIELSDEHSKYIWTTIDDAKKLPMIKWDYALLDMLKNFFKENYFDDQI